MEVSINYILPILLLILTGICAKKYLGFTPYHSNLFMKYVMKIAIPCDIIINLSRYSINDITNHLYFLKFFILVTSIVYIIVMIYALTLKKLNASESLLFAGTSCLSNSCLIAFPILNFIMGGVGVIYGLLSFIVLIVGVQAISLLANILISDNEQSKKTINKVLKDIVKSMKEPFFIALVIGLILSCLKNFGIVLPKSIDKTIDYFAITTAPVALLAVGMSFNFNLLKKNFRCVFEISCFKFILMPVVAWFIAKTFHLSPETTIAIMICSSISACKSIYGLAQQKNIYKDGIAAIIASTTPLTMFSLSIIIAFLDYKYPTYFASIKHVV